MTEHEQGEQGVPGEPGAAGARGERGPAGDAGEPGAAGPSGPTGYYGPAGLPGERGRVGDHGQPGADGAVGAVGAAGATGEAGVQGATGPGSRRMGLLVIAIMVVLGLAFGWALQRMFAVTDELQAQQRQDEISTARDACLATVLTDLVESLDESADLSTQTATALRAYVNAAVDGKVALADSFTLILSGEATDEEAIASLEAATAAIRTAGQVGAAFDKKSTELAETRREFPAPEIADIEACS